MFSRGQIMVKFAAERNKNTKPSKTATGQEQYKIQGSKVIKIQEEEHFDSVERNVIKDSSENKGISPFLEVNDIVENSCSEGELSDFIDYDDPRDPDYKPEKRKRNISSSSYTSEDEDSRGTLKTQINTIEVQGCIENTNDPLLSNDQESQETVNVNIQTVVGAQGTADDVLPEKMSKASKTKHKKLRMHGKSYLGVKRNNNGKKEYCVERFGRLLEPRPCGKRCNRERQRTSSKGTKCNLVTEESRATIFECFWRNMDWGEKRIYVLNNVSKNRNDTDGRKKYSFQYTLKVNNEYITVCKGLFLSTLGLKEDTVYNWMNHQEGHGLHSSIQQSTCTSSSKHPNRAYECAKEFLTNLPKTPSHYCRANSTKEYLESSYSSMAELYKDYTEYCVESNSQVYGRTKFSQLFKEMKIGFFKPKKDQCDICVGHRAGTITVEEYELHTKRKTEAASEKATDKAKAQIDPSIKVLTMDLQSLLLCPKLNASALYYRTKLCCYNFTLFDLISKNVMCYFFNETGADLCASTFVSCIVDYLSNLNLDNVQEIILYSDGCTYQNRNVILSNALLQFSMERGILVQQKFLEKGHTFMEVDSVHANIERRIRNKDIYVPLDYVRNIKAARHINPYEVKYVDNEFFKDYRNVKLYTSIRPGTIVGSPVVTDLRQIRYNTDGTIQYKINHSDITFEDIPKPRSNRSSASCDVLQPVNKHPILLKKTKYEHLQQIKKVIPKDYHSYYDALPH